MTVFLQRLSCLAFIVGVSAGQPAAAVTVYFTASELELNGDPFGPIGIGPVESVTGSFGYEVPTTVLYDCSVCSPFGDLHVTRYQATSFVAQLGAFSAGEELHGEIEVVDDFRGASDRFSAGSFSDTSDGHDYRIGLQVQASSALSSTDIPSVATLDTLAQIYPSQFFYTYHVLHPGSEELFVATYKKVRFSSTPTAAVPLPAGLPLLVGAVLVLGGLSRANPGVKDSRPRRALVAAEPK